MPQWSHVAFRPYLLNPELEGLAPVPKVQHLERKLGKPFHEMRSVVQLQEIGRAYGLRYRFRPEDLASGTLDSHRLLTYVATAGGTEVAVGFRRELMRLYNEEGCAMSDREVLLGAVAAAGVDTETAEAVLDSAAYALDVRWLDGQARKQGINMVPHYRFYTPAGTHSVSGFYNEWHFLDGIYRAFPDENDWDNWKEASQAARVVVEAWDAWKESERASRQGDEAASNKAEDAEARAKGLEEEYLRSFADA